MSEQLERRVVISGIGQSEINAGGGPSDLDLTLDACLEAVADAGLELTDIDGLSTYPGGGYGPPGLAGPGTMQLEEALRLDLNWFQGAPEGSAQLTGFVAACTAIASGLVDHVLCYRTVAEGTARIKMRAGETSSGVPAVAEGAAQWIMPFGSLAPATSLAMYAQRHMHEFGTTREQVGALAVNNRLNAGLNPKALKRDPITLIDYLDARPIAGPFGLLDCDIPCDVSTAVVLSRADYAASAPRPPVRIEALGTAFRGRPSFEYWHDYTEMNAWNAARHMWSRTDLRPTDVDFAQLYDGFSWLLLFWLEAAGFCGKGEGGAFLEGGHRIALDGELPLNTYGGQLSAGRLHGWGNIHEACLQLWGRAGDRQLARHEVAVVTVGGGSIAGSMVLVM
jgi:acetyl-CoA acetyltransferase